MNNRLALIAILLGSTLPASAQLKPLVVGRTIPTTIKFEGHRNFALLILRRKGKFLHKTPGTRHGDGWASLSPVRAGHG